MMGIQCVCEECDEVFTSQEYQEFCSKCRKKPYKKKPVFMSYNDKGNELAECLFEIVVDKADKGGTTGHYLTKELKSRYGIKRNVHSNAVSMLDRAGYLVYLEDGKIFPYKNMHTGKVYENDVENRENNR